MTTKAATRRASGTPSDGQPAAPPDARGCAHTPGPWAVSGFRGTSGRHVTLAAHVARPYGASVDQERCRARYQWTIAIAPAHECHISPEESEANAAFIVRACNSHDELLTALKDAENYLDSSLSPCDDDCTCILHLVRAAIAKAEGPAA